MEDVSYQLHTCGKSFKEVNKFLWPFRLSTTKGGMKAKRKHFSLASV
jgi:large subunit ribosomal protein L7e